MTEWCIVAIPEEDDPVWKWSSEKIPHITLLYLGEQDDPERARQITMQLQHTVNTSLTAFATSVHSRGVLGAKDADVLFFDQASVPKELYEFRSLLLKDDTIRKCYESADQYPSWTPHLTMGYPTSPAKKPKNHFESDSLRMVYFDRIALWIADYDGPTFKLGYRKSYEIPEDAMAMSDQTREFLAHREPERPTYTPRYLSRPAPSNLKHHGIGARTHNYTHPIQDAVKPALKATLSSTAEISDDIRYLKHADAGGLLVENSIQKQYVRENQLAFAKHLAHAVGGRPSETADIRYDVATLPNGDWLLSSVNTMAHTGTVETRVRPHLDERGLIIDYSVMADNVAQDDLRYAIVHYGVKGMKWGIRRKSRDGGGSGEVSEKKLKRQEAKEAKQAARKQKVSETIKRPVSEDAAGAAKGRQRTKKHGTDALSNQELKVLVQRMNLEQQYANLQANEKAAKARKSGRTYVNDIFKQAGQELAKEAVKYAATEGLKYAFNQASEAREERRTTRIYPDQPPALPPGNSGRRRAIGG